MKNLLTLFCMLVLVSIVQAQDFTFYPEFSAMQINQTLDNGKTQPGSLMFAIFSAINLLKRFTQIFQVFSGNSLTLVLYLPDDLTA